MYDAWGKPIVKTGTMAATLGIFNPFRYRGYVFDEETSCYYLQARYYDPSKSRFFNSDIQIGRKKSLAHNLFSYCSNRVICFADTLGLEEAPCLWYVRCAPNIEISIAEGVTVRRGDVITSKASTGDNVHSWITLQDGRTGIIDNYYVTGIKPWGIADVYGEPEMGPQKELNPENVRNLQRDLLILGYYNGQIDGQYGERTIAAVVAFGRDEGLNTGKYAGPKIKNRLFEKTYAYYDNMQDLMTQSYWEGYNDGRHN